MVSRGPAVDNLEAQKNSSQVLSRDKLALFYSMQSVLTSHTEFELIYLRAERTYSYTHSRPLLPLLSAQEALALLGNHGISPSEQHRLHGHKRFTKKREGVGGRGGSL